MTEAEWLACADPQPMLEVLRGKASDRKLRLFAVACCRRIWHLFTEEADRHAVEFAERLADHLATNEARRALLKSYTEGGPYGLGRFVNWASAHYAAERAFQSSAVAIAKASQEGGSCSWENALRKAFRAIAPNRLDIFGPLPFRPVILNPAWLTSTVQQLAESIYQDRAFDRMPILGDALEDAGCNQPDILGHCRGPEQHVKGCWVVDLLLGKE